MKQRTKNKRKIRVVSERELSPAQGGVLATPTSGSGAKSVATSPDG